MSKNISVEDHLKRYEDTDPHHVLDLIKGLTEMLERRRVEEIEKVKKHLAVLESGEIPAAESVAQRKTRSPKKVKE